MPTQQRLLGERACQTLSNVCVRLVHEFFNQLRRRGRVEDVVLDGDVLVIQLLEEAERSDGLTTSPEACFTELLGQNLG